MAETREAILEGELAMAGIPPLAGSSLSITTRRAVADAIMVQVPTQFPDRGAQFMLLFLAATAVDVALITRKERRYTRSGRHLICLFHEF